jgi:hypothetical protein
MEMGALRTRIGPVGRPFTKGNRGGGRKKGVPNKATQEIKEFARNFLMSEEYRENLKQRILAGAAPHLEVLLHHYGFGKPKSSVEILGPGLTGAALMKSVTADDVKAMVDLARQLRPAVPVEGRVVASRVLTP